MKKMLALLLLTCLALFPAACTEQSVPEQGEAEEQKPTTIAPDENTTTNPNEPFPGKIAIVSNATDSSYDEFHSVDVLIQKYGAGKIDLTIMSNSTKIFQVITKIAADAEIRALIFHQATLGTSIATLG